MSGDDDASQWHSREETIAAFRGLSAVDLLALEKIARARCYNRSIEPDDLLQNAWAAILSTRRWPRGTPLMAVLSQMMRGLAHDATINGNNRLFDRRHDPASEYVMAYPDQAPTAEERVIEDEGEAAIVRAACAPFADDPQARDIVEGTLAGMQGTELRELTGLDLKAFATKRRLIRRRLEKAYPKRSSS